MTSEDAGANGPASESERIAPPSGPADLTDQTAVVTGANGGLGRAICEALSREGADIVAADRSLENIEELVDVVEATGRECVPVSCDVTDRDSEAELAAATLDRFGSVEILVTSHGVVTREPLPEIDYEAWERDLIVNLTGTFLVTRAFYGDMCAREYGKIVCIGSLSGRGGGAGVRPAYAAAKAGIHGFVRDVAQHGAQYGVYANAVAPALVRTPMTESDDQGDHPQRPPGSSSFPADYSPLGRVGVPEDVAESVVFLASQQSHWITGTVLNVDGGHTLES